MLSLPVLALQRKSVQHKLQSAEATPGAATVMDRAEQFLLALRIDVLNKESEILFFTLLVDIFYLVHFSR